MPNLKLLLRADAVANVLLGVVGLIAAPLAADAIGIVPWPVYVAGMVLVGSGVAHWIAATDPSAGALRFFIGGDLGFVALALLLVVADPTGLEPWIRWVLVGLAAVVAGVAVAKILFLTQGVAEPVPAASRTA